ncbi:MAG TPA: hypothetical protein PL067_09485 [Bacteroidales bacterium]|nr:hypothetical protein [Candidatus Fermentibacter daniensis]HPO40942.1 hypothetical protein [Bacteroidales bacterium]
MLTKYKSELAEKRIAREELEQECTDISKLLDYAFGVLLNARTLWLEANPDQRQRLQRAIFPHWVEYSPILGFGTPPTSCQFNVLGLFREPEIVMAFLKETPWKNLLVWFKGFSGVQGASGRTAKSSLSTASCGTSS